MAISFPVWQAQLMRLQGAPQPQAPVWGPPDVTGLLQRGAAGIGAALRQPEEDRLKREELELRRRQLEAIERYQQGQLGVAEEKLDLERQQRGAWGALASELGGLGGPYGPAAPGPPGAGGGVGAPGNASLGTPTLPRFAQGTLDPFKGAIQGIESGGNYGIVGPTHPKYGRALGAYQVMESNLPEWSHEALGRKVSPEEFLASPAIQDRIFEHKFGNYLKIYGNPQDAASMWHSGRPLSVAAQARAKDSLGTSTTDYVSKFTQALTGGGMPGPARGPVAQAPPPPMMMPQQVASLDPTAGLVPPPMQGTPAPPPVDPQSKARDIGTQQQAVPGPALFPNPPTMPPGPGGPGMQMPPLGPAGGPQTPALPQPLSPPPLPVQTAQAPPTGVREVVPAQTQAGGIDRNSPQVRGFLAKAMAAGPEAFAMANKYLDAVSPAPTGRYTNSERGVFDTHTGKLVAPPAMPDGSSGMFGNSMQGRALEAAVARGHIPMDDAVRIAGGQVIGAPGGEQQFYTPEALSRAIGGGPGAPVGPGVAAPPVPGGAPAGAGGFGVQLVPPKTEKADVLPPNAALAVSMGNEFLARDLPKIKDLVRDKPETLDSYKGRAMYAVGIGDPGEVARGLGKAQEALVRLLTGAAMNRDEAIRYSQRYGFRPERDSIADLRKKLDEVESMVKVGRAAVLGGRKIDTKELIGWEDAKSFTSPGGRRFEEVK